MKWFTQRGLIQVERHYLKKITQKGENFKQIYNQDTRSISSRKKTKCTRKEKQSRYTVIYGSEVKSIKLEVFIKS